MMTANKSPDFVLTRVFDAPRDLVWKCFADAEAMKEWWGPKGFTVIVSKMDLRVGGSYLYGMKAPDGTPMWGKFQYREIVPPEKMVFINSFSDEAGGVTRHPLHVAWPLEMLTSFTFEELPGGKTKLTTRSRAYNATADEQNTFDSNHNSLRMGWGGTMDKLEAYLAGAR